MIRIAVCDDNEILLGDLSKRIYDKMTSFGYDPKVELFNNAASFLKARKIRAFDVVFLDIVMPDISGFEAAAQLKRDGDKSYIIFITTESQLVFDSFDFNPFYFIPKDNDAIFEDRLEHVLEKLAVHMSADRPICIECPYNEKIFIEPHTIIYIKSHSNYIDYLCDGREDTITVRRKIESVLGELSEMIFTRIHNRIIINMQHIRKIDYPNSSVYMDNNDILPISRANKKILIEKYNNFLEKYE